MAESIIKSNNALITGTITPLISGGTFEQFSCYKIGNIVNVGARIYGTSTSGAGNYFQLPEGFRPRTETSVTGHMTTNQGVYDGNVRISTNGIVSMYISNTMIASQIGFEGTFVI